jgi:hypothetical protein
MPPAEKGWALFLSAGSALEMGDYEPALKVATAALVEFDQANEASGAAWAHLMRAAALPNFGFAADAATSVGHVAEARWTLPCRR